MSDYLLKGGTLVSHERQFKADLLIKDGKIAQITEGIELDDVEVIDCTGKFVLPGVIDPHVHFREPGYPEREDFYSGSRAAARGGTTTIFDMPNTNPATVNAQRVDEKLGFAAEKSLVNYGIYAGATPHNAQDLLAVKDKVMGIKIYMGSSTGDLLVDKREWLEEFFKLGMQIVVHAENEEHMKRNMEQFKDVHDPEVHSVIRSNEVAAEATQMAIEIGEENDTKLHIAHMSTKEELLLVQKAHERNYRKLSCEVCPHHLFLNRDMYGEKGTYLRVNPPVRSKEDVKALWEDGIALGGVDMMATDHAPHLQEKKEQDYWLAPSGMPGVQEALTLMLNRVAEGKLSLEKVVELSSYMPAKIFAVNDRGQMKEGLAADLVVVDMEKTQTLTNDMLETRCGWSNYEGWELTGWPVMTFVNGNMVWDGEEIIDGSLGQHVTRSD